MQFLADGMLGRLAKWLRILGYDTVYQADAHDYELIRRARAESRILLTRDVELAQRPSLQSILITSDDVVHQLHQVLRTCQLTTHAAFSRCPVCNTLLADLEPNLARTRVPPYVSLTQTQFSECPECKRIYWRGTHWARMQARLADLNSSGDGQE